MSATRASIHSLSNVSIKSLQSTVPEQMLTHIEAAAIIARGGAFVQKEPLKEW
jgi:hypothetical protein